MTEKILKFKVNMINTDVLKQLKKLESDGYITQFGNENEDIKVGDTRFCIYEGFRKVNEIAEMKLRKITSKKNGTYYTFEGVIGKYTQTLTFKDSSFGKKVFLTYDDAVKSIEK